ncbi:MAG: hypothetical protein WCB09_17125, partial [Methylocella sp.]
ASRAKAALSAGVMSSAGLPVHMQRSIHVPDHIVKRCVRLYTSVVGLVTRTHDAKQENSPFALRPPGEGEPGSRQESIVLPWRGLRRPSRHRRSATAGRRPGGR